MLRKIQSHSCFCHKQDNYQNKKTHRHNPFKQPLIRQPDLQCGINQPRKRGVNASAAYFMKAQVVAFPPAGYIAERAGDPPWYSSYTAKGYLPSLKSRTATCLISSGLFFHNWIRH